MQKKIIFFNIPYIRWVYIYYSYYILNLIAIFYLIKFYSNLTVFQLQWYFILKLMDIIIVL